MYGSGFNAMSSSDLEKDIAVIAEALGDVRSVRNIGAGVCSRFTIGLLWKLG